MIRKFGKFFVFYIISCIVTAMLFTIALRFIGYHPAATIRNKISTRFRERQENVLIAQTDAADENSYYEKTEAFGIFDNTPDHAFPATVIYKLVMDHFSSELPEGKTQKKLLFIGFDGYRTDALENILGSEESAILTVGEQGGIYYSFSGGISGENEQDTSTDPTWTAMLTGGWGDYNGITRNGQMKNEQETFLTSLAKQGYSGTFNTGWQELLNVCFIPDIELSIREKLPVKYQYIPDDADMYYEILSQITRPSSADPDGPDVIFAKFSFPDATGHTGGYNSANALYQEKCREADQRGFSLIQTLKERSTYALEDWLIIISTDHGGKGKGHGGQSILERSTWIAINKPVPVTDEYLCYALHEEHN